MKSYSRSQAYLHVFPFSQELRPQSLRPWSDKAIALMDLDAFFASVEQMDKPEYRGKPVIVGGRSSRRGVVATASYEARAYGVRSAMPAAQAQRLCPEAIWISPRMKRYKEVSNQVMKILTDETPFVEQCSIDEAFFDISPTAHNKEHPLIIARRIQKRVSQLGISCSIGLSNNKSCSKIASNKAKPTGLCAVYPGDEQNFLAPLPIKELSGLGPQTQFKLAQIGIKTLGQLAEADTIMLKDYLGVWGPRLQLRARGINDSEIIVDDPIKSVSHERTFAEDMHSGTELEAVLGCLCALVGRRMRKLRIKGGTLHLRLRFDYEHSKSIQCKLPYPSDNERNFYPQAKELLHKIYIEGMGVRLLGVGLSDFDAQPTQLELFSSPEAQELNDSITKAADKIKDKFGDLSLVYGRELRFKDSFADGYDGNHFKERSGPSPHPES